MAEKKTVISGKLRTWSLDPTGEHARRYIHVSTTFEEASGYIVAKRFDALTGDGEQRSLVVTHALALKREVRGHNYTPTSVAASVREHQRQFIKTDKEGNVTITLRKGEVLCQADGNHRFAALRMLAEDFESDKKMYEMVMKLPIEAIVYLDGSPRRDFINLQRSKAVDPAHMQSIKLAEGLEIPEMVIANKVAWCLNEDMDSPYRLQIKFDSHGTYPMSISTFTSKGASGLSTSLVGLARMAMGFDDKVEARWLADVMLAGVKAIAADPDISAEGMPLCPPPNGNRGTATMLICPAICLAYRLLSEKRKEVTDADLMRLVAAAKGSLFRPCVSLSAQTKRALAGKFACEYFTDLDDGLHEGVPLGLLATVPPSSFDLSPLPKKKKGK